MSGRWRSAIGWPLANSERIRAADRQTVSGPAALGTELSEVDDGLGSFCSGRPGSWGSRGKEAIMGVHPAFARLSAVSLVLLLLSVLVPATVSASPMLREGARGPDVIELQSRLANLDYDVGPVDGRFGPATRSAVVAFQKANGLARDGVVGPKTWGALGSASVTPPRSVTPPSSVTPPKSTAPVSAASVLRQGARGPEVAQLQNQLTKLRYDVGPADGRFGSGTTHAVVAFQKVNGLTRDGLVGSKTRAALAKPMAPTLRRVRTGTYVEIDLTRQVLLVAKDGRIDRIVNTSTGKSSTPTPTGTFRIERRIDGYRHAPLGTLWRPAYFRGGYAIHGYPSVPSHAASSGCARVPNPSMNRMWSQLRVGTPVQIYR